MRDGVVLRKNGEPSRKAGETAWNARLTAGKVRRIRRLREDYGAPVKWLAKRFGVSDGCIHYVIHRKTWKHL